MPAGRPGARPGLPGISDGQLLFLLHMLVDAKDPRDGGSRVAVIMNGRRRRRDQLQPGLLPLHPAPPAGGDRGRHPRPRGRHRGPALEAALADTPVVLVVGPRQAGKTTLCRLVAHRRGARVLSLDDAATLAAASADPAGFVAALDGPVVLDEIQKAPALLPAIKLAVDRRREPGRFLLTGSADVVALPRVSESLAGRMEVLTLWPLSQGELAGHQEGFIDAMFAAANPKLEEPGAPRDDLVERALRGGFPEAVARRDPERRRAWFRSYVTTMLERDVRDLARVEGSADLPRLLTALAARSASLLNVAELSRSMGLPQTTLARYLTLLERAFLVRRLPAWAGSRARRVIKTPRVWIPDTGLLGHLAGLTSARLAAEPAAVGPLLETFVAAELAKQAGWSRIHVELFHFRTHAGREVDIVLEATTAAWSASKSRPPPPSAPPTSTGSPPSGTWLASASTAAWCSRPAARPSPSAQTSGRCR